MLKRDAEGTVKRVENAKVVVFAQGVDTTSTETKVPVLCQPFSAIMPEGYLC